MNSLLLSDIIIAFWFIAAVNFMFTGIFLSGYVHFRHDLDAQKDLQYAAFHFVMALFCLAFIYLAPVGK